MPAGIPGREDPAREGTAGAKAKMQEAGDTLREDFSLGS